MAMLYATDWHQRQCDNSCIIGGMALSGVYDLAPLRQCSMNADLHIDDFTARAVSPVELKPTLTVPLHLAVGAEESEAFLSQSRQLAARWPQICDNPEEVASANHFTVVDFFAQATHPIFLRVLRLFN